MRRGGRRKGQIAAGDAAVCVGKASTILIDANGTGERQ